MKIMTTCVFVLRLQLNIEKKKEKLLYKRIILFCFYWGRNILL